jgi:ethanolaminephosphotransferase
MAKSVNGEKPAMRSHKGFLRFLTGRYLSQTMCKNLLQYKYDGEDRSYLYRFVLQPMNAFLIRFVPIWAAPNLLTLSGLMLMVIGYLMTYYYAPTFETVMPSWCYLACSFVLYGYQTIDNLDGRQARRTGSSSPLGLLFDHGVDALNCTFASLLLAAVYSIGNLGPVLLFLFWNIGFIPFVVATWEECQSLRDVKRGMSACLSSRSDPLFLLFLFDQTSPGS